MPDCSERWVRSMETVTAGETARRQLPYCQRRRSCEDRRCGGLARLLMGQVTFESWRSFCQPTSGRRNGGLHDHNGFLFDNGFLFVAISGNHYFVMVQRGLTQVETFRLALYFVFFLSVAILAWFEDAYPEVQMVWLLVLIVLVLVVCFTLS
jgi:hypothetical protein